MTQEIISQDPFYLLDGLWVLGIAYTPITGRVYFSTVNPNRIASFWAQYKDQTLTCHPVKDVTNVNSVGGWPYTITCNPKTLGAYAITNNDSGSASSGTVSFSVQTNKGKPAQWVPPLTVFYATNMAFSPDGSMAYFPGGYSLIAIPEKTGTPSPIPTTVYTQWIAVTKDGSLAYVGGNGGGLAYVDLKAMEQKGTITLAEGSWTFAVNDDGKKLFVALETQIVVIDIASNKKIHSIPYSLTDSQRFGQISCSTSGPRACILVADDNEASRVDIIDTNSYKVIKSFSTGPGDKRFEVYWSAYDGVGNAYVSTMGGAFVIPVTAVPA